MFSNRTTMKKEKTIAHVLFIIIILMVLSIEKVTESNEKLTT